MNFLMNFSPELIPVVFNKSFVNVKPFYHMVVASDTGVARISRGPLVLWGSET